MSDRNERVVLVGLLLVVVLLFVAGAVQIFAIAKFGLNAETVGVVAPGAAFLAVIGVLGAWLKGQQD